VPSAHSERYFAVLAELAQAVDADAMAKGLAALRDRGGRLFVLGVGGGARHASQRRERLPQVVRDRELPEGRPRRGRGAVLVAPPADLRTPLVESFQAVVWHALVSHPALALRQGHWETIAYRAAGRIL
jgi:hypothetical protein